MNYSCIVEQRTDQYPSVGYSWLFFVNKTKRFISAKSHMAFYLSDEKGEKIKLSNIKIIKVYILYVRI